MGILNKGFPSPCGELVMKNSQAIALAALGSFVPGFHPLAGNWL